MILFIILLLMLVMITVITVVSISIGGVIFVILFADVIVCIAIILWLIKRRTSKKEKKSD